MNKNIFRAYDIRGNSKTDLDQPTITKIGYVLGKRIKKIIMTQFMLDMIVGFLHKKFKMR